jgi:hypothetical protein
MTKPNPKTRPHEYDHKTQKRDRTNKYFQKIKAHNFGLSQRQVRRILDGKTKSIHVGITAEQVKELVLVDTTSRRFR